MGNIIFLKEKRNEKENRVRSLTEFLEEFSKEKKKAIFTQFKNKETFTISEFKKFLEVRISDKIIEQKRLERETFLCSNYVASLLASMLHPEKIETWSGVEHLIEYEKKKDSETLKKGADVCFFFYTFFLDQNIPQLKLSEDIGIRLYFLLHRVTGQTIALSMGKNFPFMGKIAHYSLKNF